MLVTMLFSQTWDSATEDVFIYATCSWRVINIYTNPLCICFINFRDFIIFHVIKVNYFDLSRHETD